jgi:hypothetical protein
MRVLILGALGPYPERVKSFIDDGHRVWYACTETLYVRETLPNFTPFALSELSQDFVRAIAQLARLIESQRIDVVYSLLNVWDGSNRATAALLRSGCAVPVIGHYKEHYLAPSEEERTCIEQCAGAIFINEESRDYFAKVYWLPEQTACLDADLIPQRYLKGELQPNSRPSTGDRIC